MKVQNIELDRERLSRRNVSLELRARAKELRNESTPAERKLWNSLRKKQLDGRRFRRQHPIEYFIVDFFCLQEGLVIEVDGGVHLEQKDRDTERQTILEKMGLKVIRFSNDEVEYNLAQVISVIRNSFSPIASPLPSRAV